MRQQPLKFEKSKEPNNIFERYDIGNPNLPAHKHEKEIVDTIEANKVSIFSGATGCGKTTQLPQMLLKAGYDHIFVLQPRRINADGADRVEYEIQSKMGDDYPEGLVGVGHSERMTISPRSKVDFLTAGTFMNMLPQIQKEYAGKKISIVVDETHENGLPTEFASALALQAVEEENDWRMVYASATPDKTLKSNPALAGVNGKEVPEIHIEGQPQNIEYEELPDEDIIEAYINHAEDSKKAMIFVEGIPAALNTRKELLKAMSKTDADRTKTFMLSSGTTAREKEAIKNMNLIGNQRAVVISTAAGQSGITIPGLDLVITSGITRGQEIDDEKADGLPIRLDTKAELTQKGGRTGRDVPGRHLHAKPWAEHKSGSVDELRKFVSYADREEDIPPEVYHTNLASSALMVAAIGRDFTTTNGYMKNRLSSESIASANDVLYTLGAIDEDDAITEIGKRMNRYSVRPELARALIEFETNTERSMQIQALAIAAAIDNGGLIDHYGSKAWKDIVRPSSTNDYMAQLDLMAESRKFYHGPRHIDDRELRMRGINALAAQKIHHRFDKMARVMGIDDTREIEIEPATEDQANQILESFLMGMPELIFEHAKRERDVDYYVNSSFQAPLERKISNRSILSEKMGKKAVEFLVGFPRFYIDKDDRKQDIIEHVFPIDKEQIARKLGGIATRARKPEMRGGKLVNTGQATIAGVSIGGKETVPMRAKTADDKEKLAQATLREGNAAVAELYKYGMSVDDILDALVDHAEGAGSTSELNSRLWYLVAEQQAKFAGKN